MAACGRVAFVLYAVRSESHSALHTIYMPLCSLTVHCTQHTCSSTVPLCTAHNTHAALQSHSALYTTHMPYTV